MKKQKLFTALTDEQSEKVVGGVGRGPAPGAGVNGWGADETPSAGHGLFGAGFLGFVPNPNSAVEVFVPGEKGD